MLLTPKQKKKYQSLPLFSVIFVNWAEKDKNKIIKIPSAREAMFNQMVDKNPVFSPEEKELIKKRFKEAQTKAEKFAL